MPKIINLDKEWENVSEAIYDLLSDQPTNDLANSILSVLEEYAARKEIVELPVRIGDTLYEIHQKWYRNEVRYKIVPRMVESIEIGRSWNIIHCGRKFFMAQDLGSTVFKTEEEAVKRLKLICERKDV